MAALAKIKNMSMLSGSSKTSTPRGVATPGGDSTPGKSTVATPRKGSTLSLLADAQVDASEDATPRGSVSDSNDVLAKTAVRKCEEFPLTPEEVHASKFIKMKKIGKGAIGIVYMARLKEEADGEEVDSSKRPKLYAIKVVTKDEMVKKNKVARVMTEREVLATTSHPFVVKMYASFQTNNKLFYCMELMAGGEFYRMLQALPEKRMNEQDARFYTSEVTSALEYLHACGFVYRDLKPENVLVRADGHLALSDFDLSKQAVAQSAQVVEKKKGFFGKKNNNGSRLDMLNIVNAGPVFEGDAKSFVGTAEYLSPEVISGEQQTAAVDWWTLGVLMYEMIFGVTPFRGDVQDVTFANIISKELKFPADIPVSKECKELLKKLLTRDAKKRLGSNGGSSEIKSHKWFAETNWGLLREQVPPIVPGMELPANWTQMKVTMDKLDATEGSGQATEGTNAFTDFNATTTA
ncbi:Serine/threonine-protein kinase KIN82 [Porphyridium purpureum]|uniref:non-specific serine/threonine protein kinase n=1 Tax=Porphyridium purpureum TaxID=35688 RepID=A0A5J4YYF9_PORPP|nr:Serine/threonine-protein kinase KIN82 [Porphyridium purpureum]|eukprot:POR6907..scf209_3